MKGAVRPVDVANRHPRLRVSRRAVSEAVRLLDSHAHEFRGGCPEGELSVALVTGRRLALLHSLYMGDPSETDVITFGGDPANGFAGEICISADAAARVAAGARSGLSGEITLYVVHGWLHLAGYDDRSPRAKRAMRRAEARAMRLLVRSGAVPRFKLA